MIVVSSIDWELAGHCQPSRATHILHDIQETVVHVRVLRELDLDLIQIGQSIFDVESCLYVWMVCARVRVKASQTWSSSRMCGCASTPSKAIDTTHHDRPQLLTSDEAQSVAEGGMRRRCFENTGGETMSAAQSRGIGTPASEREKASLNGLREGPAATLHLDLC